MENLITPRVKLEIIKLTTFLSGSFCNNNKTDLLAICRDESIHLHFDNYGEYFDGMLVWDSLRFHIHLNTWKGNDPEGKRGRFTLAHEFGHYFLDTHREGIKRGLIPSHPSRNALVHSDRMEAEADYFASCLLIPRERLRRYTQKRKFSLDLLKEVSDEFGVSLTAAAIRFSEVGTHEIMVVFSENNQVKWFSKSQDFPNLAHKFRVGGPPPPTSVVGESFRKSDSQYTTIEPVDLEDWFHYKPGSPTWQLYEQCFYSDIYNYVISTVWFE